MRRLLGELGVESHVLEDGALRLSSDSTCVEHEAPWEQVKTMRASVLVLGPLLATRGQAEVSLPGGCAIGARPIDQHLDGLAALGAEVELSHGNVIARAHRLRGADFTFALPTVTGTMNVMMAATLASGSTRLHNCAREPEVTDLADLLTAMGAQISGASSATIEIEGVDRLGGCRHRVIADRIEVGTYLAAAAITRGDVSLRHAEPTHLAPLLEKLEECGATVEARPEQIRVTVTGELEARDVITAPYPGYPTDLQAQYMALMTQASGTATICETVFENRFQHVPELRRLGADIEIEGRFARVRGPRQLSGAKVMATDLRASASLVLAGLIANGETWVDRIYHLDRGYQSMESKLQNLGASVERVG